MQYYDAKLIISAAKKEQFPSSDKPEFILVGRSNVGKSSLINCLVNRKSLAYVGSKPGKTRLLNFYDVDDKMILVDAPGYGFANRSQKELIAFGDMMEDYFASRTNLKCVIQIVDLRHKPTKDDIDMINFAREYKLKVLVVATKYDKVKSSERTSNLKLIKETLNINDSSIIMFSSETRFGLENLWTMIWKMC